MRFGRMSTIFAFVCRVSVTMPACDPVSDTARWPMSSIAIAQRAAVMRSPVESSMSISRGCGRGDTSAASAASVSVVSPMADTTPTVGRPVSWVATMRRATLRILSVSATEVPPNFITLTRPTCADAGSFTRAV